MHRHGGPRYPLTLLVLLAAAGGQEPVRQLHVDARILHWEQGRCNLSLVCTVAGASNVSYNWSCTGGPPGALEHQPWLHLQVHGDADPAVCCCNASNPVSWSTASTDVVAACRAAAPGLVSILLWWGVALGLALAISVALVVTCYWRRKREKDPPRGHVEQTLTVYEDVGKAQTSQDANTTSEATVGGNTIYAVICTNAKAPSCPQEPKSCTIYSTVQPTRKVRLPRRDSGPSAAAQKPGSPRFVNRVLGSLSRSCLMAGSRSAPQSPLKRKRLDPALVSTAYAEVTGTRPALVPPVADLAPSSCWPPPLLVPQLPQQDLPFPMGLFSRSTQSTSSTHHDPTWQSQGLARDGNSQTWVFARMQTPAAPWRLSCEGRRKESVMETCLRRRWM
ncbi:uncharacterized protein M6G45_015906 isoform 4-T4 [Spheniscus humboldti]